MTIEVAELPAVKTTMTPLELVEGLVLAHRVIHGEDPTLGWCMVHGAHVALETWWTKLCYCWQVGNKKRTAGRCWTFYPCGEELEASYARKLAAQSPDLVKIQRFYAENGVQKASVHFLPKHPISAFEAYRTKVEGLAAYCAMFEEPARYAPARPYAIAGDADGFARTIGRLHYFTAPIDHYAYDLALTAGGYPRKLPPGWKPSDVDEHTENAEPAITDADRAAVAWLVALTVDEERRELLDGPTTPRNT